jgi:hypothetical protein
MLTPEDQQAYELVKDHGSIRSAARMSGVPRSTLRNRYLRAKDILEAGTRNAQVEFPSVPHDDLPIDELLSLRVQRFKAKQENHKARLWQPIRINSNEPIVLAFVGDPHLDDDGCNMPLLLEHVEFLKRPNVFAVNIGDTTNNWTGRLMRLYAKQETSLKTARRYADWFLNDAGINWLVWLIGNHDEWEQGAEILARMNSDKITMENWEARFRVVFKNNFEVPVWASHDFAGNSQWNKLHGPMKAAMMRGGAGVYACGHKHTWGMHAEEIADTGTVFHVLRARGYKFMDDYAKTGGFPENQLGASMAVVIDPEAANQAEAVTPFNDLEKAVTFRDAL